MTVIDYEIYLEMKTDYGYQVVSNIVKNIDARYREKYGYPLVENWKYSPTEKRINFGFHDWEDGWFVLAERISEELDGYAAGLEKDEKKEAENIEFELLSHTEWDFFEVRNWSAVRKDGKLTAAIQIIPPSFDIDIERFRPDKNGQPSFEMSWMDEDGEHSKRCSSYDEFRDALEEVCAYHSSYSVCDRIDEISREIWDKEVRYCSELELFINDDGVFTDLDFAYEWNDVGDVPAYLSHQRRLGFLSADEMIINAMDESGIPHDEHTLEELSLQDAYDILGGTYDREKSKNRPTVAMLEGKNFVFSTLSLKRRKEAATAIGFIDGKVQSEIGPDTDFVVYNEKLADKGDNYRLALELNEQGRDIRLITHDDLCWIVFMYWDSMPPI